MITTSRPATPEPESPASGEIHVTARLNHKLMPMDRGDRYEDSLHEALEEAGLGSADGGGTLLCTSGEIEFVDVELDLVCLEKSVPLVIERLTALGAPSGSKLIIQDDPENPREVPFGNNEGIAIYFDGVNLPAEVYEKEDINKLIEQITELLADTGSIDGYWDGPTETAAYIYGPDAEVIRRRLNPLLNTHPLCQGARVVTIAPAVLS